MSIVEKAIRRDADGHRHRESTKVSSPDVRGQNLTSNGGPPLDSIELSNLAERGLISVLEDPDLSRAFQFVKRSVLAKLFSPTRTVAESGKVIMITSPLPGAGKSFVAFNLAVSIAQEELINVVLIDADTVRHSLTTTLGLGDAEGLVEILTTRNMSNRAVSTNFPGLRFVPAGQAHRSASELLASAYMAEVLATFTEHDTVVVIDTTPLLVSNEADAMSTHVGQAIVVVEAGVTSVDEIESALQILKKSGSPIGFMMNKLKSLTQNGNSDYYYESY